MQTRIELINHLSAKFGYKTYLEIGIRDTGDCYDHIAVESKDSVDPGLETNNNTAKYKFTSDEFFRQLEAGSLDKPAGFKWDIIFIDGLHVSYQVDRDIENSMRHLSHNGTIVVHDCNPPTEHHARCDYYDHRTPAGDHWNGTVWKSIYKLRCTYTDVDVCVINMDWGCGVVRRGNQHICDFSNPYYDYDRFAANRKRHLNLIEPGDLDRWLDSPFYYA